MRKILYHFQFSSQRFYAVKMFLTLIAKSKCTIQICLQSKREKWKFVLLKKTPIYQQQSHADYVQGLCFNPLHCEALNEVKNANHFFFLMCTHRCAPWFGLKEGKVTCVFHKKVLAPLNGSVLRDGRKTSLSNAQRVCGAQDETDHQNRNQEGTILQNRSWKDLRLSSSKARHWHYLGISHFISLLLGGEIIALSSASSAHATYFNSLKPFKPKWFSPYAKFTCIDIGTIIHLKLVSLGTVH